MIEFTDEELTFIRNTLSRKRRTLRSKRERKNVNASDKEKLTNSANRCFVLEMKIRDFQKSLK